MTENSDSRPAAILALLALLLASSPAPTKAATQKSPPMPVFGERVSVQWILVPVVVRTPDGYVRDLEPKDFKLLVDSQPVQFQSFERGTDAPLSLAYLQDLSGSMAGSKLEASRDTLRFFVDQARPDDELALASFAGGYLQVEVPFTTEVSVLREAAAVWDAYGTTALHDAVAWLPDIAVDGRNPKRAAILVTDGVDNASILSPEQSREIVRQAQLPVYVLGLGTGNSPLAKRDAPLNRYADLLQRLATITGGRYYALSGPQEVQAAEAEIANDLRFQYILGFPTREAGPQRFRRIQIDVRKYRGHVHHRRGYHGTGPR